MTEARTTPLPPRCQLLTIEVSNRDHALLTVLTKGEACQGGKVEDVIALLIDHAQQGVYRPGSWERNWLHQVFGDDWIAHLERDPDAPMFQRPIAA